MACSCKKKTIVYQNKKVQIYDRGTYPFDSCLQCAKKHLGLSLMLYNMGQKKRAITNVYLAYKHMQKRYADLAKPVFALYHDLLKGLAFENDIKIMVKFFMQKYKHVVQSETQTQLHLEEELTKQEQLRTYVWSAYELMFHQFGYDELNKPYAIGYLQQAVQLQQDKVKQELIRYLWIEQDKQKFDTLLTNM